MSKQAEDFFPLMMRGKEGKEIGYSDIFLSISIIVPFVPLLYYIMLLGRFT